MEFNITWKYKDYELRKTAPLNDVEPYWELVKWNQYRGKATCFTFAYFKKDSEGWELKFVGNRPFEYIDTEDLFTIWEALKMTDTTLNNYFKINRTLE